MTTPTICSLQAMAGRFLATTELTAWDDTSHGRCLELVRAFQRKDLDPAGLHAALTSERLGTRPPAPAAGAIALVELVGVLTPAPSLFSFLGYGTSVRDFIHTLTAAAYNPKVTAITVVVDSPGGSIGLIPEAAAAMRQARTRKPVVVSVAGLAASAAYWVASNATAIEATSSAGVGSIGVFVERVSVAKRLEREGVDVTVVSAGKFKREGHQALPITEAEQRALQQRVDAAYTNFVDDISTGRHVLAATVRTGFGQGRLVDAPDGVRLGMIDRVATTEDTITRVLTAPAAFTALLTRRADMQGDAFDRLCRDHARAEIAAHRARLQAAAHRAQGLR